MIKRSTWVIVIIFLLAIIALVLIKYQPGVEPSATPTAVALAENYIFPAENGNLLGIRIYDTQNNIFMMERPSGGLWAIFLPSPGPADQESAEDTVNKILSLQYKEIVANPQPLSMFGLDFPVYVIKLVFESNLERHMEIGDKTPTGSGYYVRLDGDKVFIVNINGVDGITAILTSPPYLAPTSTPIPTREPTLDTLTPTPELTATP